MKKTKIAESLLQINVLLFVLIVLLVLGLTQAAKGDDTIKIMVIDTGADSEHSRISPYIYKVQREPSADAKRYLGLNIENTKDDHGHGTHVAGIILYGEMTPHNPEGEAVCKQVKIIPCRYYQNGIDAIDGSIACLRMASDLNVQYVNYSGGGTSYSKEESEAINELERKGTTIIAAAGNNGKDISKQPFYPASYKNKNIIAVGAVDNDGNKIKYSNYGLGVVFEKGKNIYSTLNGGRYGYLTGTSQAAPLRLHKILIDKCKELNKNVKVQEK